MIVVVEAAPGFSASSPLGIETRTSAKEHVVSGSGGPVLEVYTDGAYSKGKPPDFVSTGGWAWATEDGREGYGFERDTTSQRMEMRAALEAGLSVEGELCIVSDSAYVVNCFFERWYVGWAANGWRTSTRKPVANRDLWEPLIEIVEFRKIQFRKIRGHCGIEMNEYVDQLAVRAKKELCASPAPW